MPALDIFSLVAVVATHETTEVSAIGNGTRADRTTTRRSR